MGQLAGLRALVTGGASGLGAAIADAFAAEGAEVVVLDAAADVYVPPGVSYLRADITDDSAVRVAVESAVTRLGGLDLLVNNAGIGAQGTVEQSTDADWHRVLDVNVVGTARVTRAAWPYLRESAHAAVINTSSVAATTGLPQRAVYAASKGAISALTRAMAADGLADGVRVNAVTPVPPTRPGSPGSSTRPPIRQPNGRRWRLASRTAGSSQRPRWPGPSST